MKEGFLFGVGFSAAYFLFHYGCQTLIYLGTKLEYRRTYKQQMKAIKEGSLAGGQAQAQHREYSN